MNVSLAVYERDAVISLSWCFIIDLKKREQKNNRMDKLGGQVHLVMVST
jgi:hypothetical protein